MLMKIIDKILGTYKVNWQELHDLQPTNLKLPYYSEKTKASIKKYGFVNPILVWQDPITKVIKITDGHCRRDLLNELYAEGYEIPKELSCTFLDNTQIKTEQEVIKILLEVFNSKSNPIDKEVLMPFLEENLIELKEIPLEQLHIKEIPFDSIMDASLLEPQQPSLQNKNKEIDIDKLDTSECKIVLKFDAMQYESILSDMNEIKEKENIKTNELLMIRLLEEYFNNNAPC